MSVIRDRRLAMTEAAWQDKVVDLARIYQWKVAHFRPGRTKDGWTTAVQYDAKGWPDLFLCHPVGRKMLFRELKAEGGELSDDQANWRDWLIGAGADWRLWYPSDWELVIATLAKGSVR